MRILIAIAALSLIGACDSCVAAPQLPPPRYVDNQENVSRMLNATIDFVMLDPEDPGGSTYRSFCSGFFVSPTTLGTAGHCLLSRPDPFTESDPEMGQVFAYRMYGSETVHHARVTGYDGDHDVGLLEIGASEPRQPRFFEIEQNDVRVGDPVWVVGNPGPFRWVLSDGIISHLEYDAVGHVTDIMANANIFFGNSGGPCLNNSGRLIGVADAIGMRQSYLGIFVIAKHVTALMMTAARR